jgi:hypothetical protein
VNLPTLRRLPPPWVALTLAALTAAACHRASPAERAAGPILEKNAAARGGLSAWRAVKSMSLSGKLEAGTPRDPVKLARSFQRTSAQAKAEPRLAAVRSAAAEEKSVQLPFTLDLERPRKARLEVEFRGQTAVQVYDGEKGWKLRPFLGRHEVEPFSAEELRVAAQQTDLDGLLLDHEAKGYRVALDGTEPVDGRDAYKLALTARDGHVRHAWVDAETYLEVRVEGTRRVDGKLRSVWTRLGDYRRVDGVMVPHLLETAVEGLRGSERIQVERVALNPKLDDRRFAKPQ